MYRGALYDLLHIPPIPPPSHTPYDTLIGGNSKTSVVLCNSMDATHIAETVATLRFGERCALIEKEARNNATMLAGVLANIDSQIRSLEADILRKERWEMREEVRDDGLAEEGTVEAAAGGKEMKKVSMVVGAEEERQQLQNLLIRRAKFTGSTLFDDEEEEEGEDGNKENASSANSGARSVNGASTQKPWKAHTKKVKKRVIGFGKEYAELYGLGGKFDESEEVSIWLYSVYIDTLYMHSIYTLYTLYIHTIYTQYTHHIHYIYTPTLFYRALPRIHDLHMVRTQHTVPLYPLPYVLEEGLRGS